MEELKVLLVRKVVLPHQDGFGEITILPGEVFVEIRDGQAYFENAKPINLEELTGYNSVFSPK